MSDILNDIEHKAYLQDGKMPIDFWYAFGVILYMGFIMGILEILKDLNIPIKIWPR